MVRVTSVELPDERSIQNMPCGDPGPLLRTIPLPVHQVLETPSPATGTKEAMDGIGRAPIDDAGWRWRRGSGDQGALMDGFDLGDVESGVDPHGPG